MSKIDNLRKIYEVLKDEELHARLKKRGLRVSGTKAEKIERLVTSDTPESFLDVLTTRELKDFCRKFGRKVSGTKGELINRLLTTNELMMKRQDVPIAKLTGEQLDRKLSRILNCIENGFIPIKKKKFQERDFEAQLVSFLRASFKSYQIDYQITTRGGRLDIVIDKDIALELKIGSTGAVQKLIGQAFMYIKEYRRLGIVILDTGHMKSSILREYIDHLQGISNVKVITVPMG